ncbi:hypothetical protein TEA_008870 [Camellia sinensis var. sinensis]|uniref:Bulb-type lectin domain-containing protein n=1 Tax=Camellia sinensis var. sinensis TaxID=542762 RepID=A0A4S4EEE5_CAMSN|nr:hypothetical protein TEA_008870 [Camellia sinensis var. sinensis]
MTVSQCESKCRHSCSCTAYAYANLTIETTLHCVNWFGALVDLNHNAFIGKDLYVCLHSSDQVSNAKTGNLTPKRRIPIAIAAATISTGLLFISIIGYVLRRGSSYMSPKYALYGQFSEKSDVFSFGVLLLEIVSGKRSTNSHQTEHSLTLIGWAWENWKEGSCLELIDPSIRDICNLQEALKCIAVGLLCVQEFPGDRPTIIRMKSKFIFSCLLDKAESDLGDNHIPLDQQLGFDYTTNIISFFNPGNSTNRYLGIWYKTISEQTVIWVANRDNLAKNSHGVFGLGDDGNLVLFDGRRRIVWSSNATTANLAMNSTIAVLLDTGNCAMAEF